MRELLVRQRTQLMNAMRGLAAEFGLVTAQGARGGAELRARIAAADPTLPLHCAGCGGNGRLRMPRSRR
ncbi:MAG: hypothetical protein JO047_04395 [Alphaproteobacteria bacterium]|nr:hypothetical protein [Alphaproteobacteria bacterium]